MKITDISNNVQTLLSNIADPSLVTVLPYPQDETNNFDGYPSATHFYTGTESDYATATQNKTIYKYSVFVYVFTNEDQAGLYTRAYNLMEDIVQMFAESIDLSSTVLGLARACDFLRPALGEMGTFTTGQGTGIVGEINLFCSADKTYRTF